MNTRYLVKSAIIAALYVVITMVFAPLSFGPVQIRFSEALVLLPMIESAAIPGLFIGCMLANLSSPFGLVDIVGGSIITLVAAYLTSKMPNKVLGIVPPVILNAFLVSAYLVILAPKAIGETFLYWPTVGSIAIGEFLSVGILGILVLQIYTKIQNINGNKGI